MFMVILLMFAHLGKALVCHECGIPGAMLCEDATRANLLVATHCSTGSCASTSYTFMSGERIEARFCNRDRNYACSDAQQEIMNYDTCMTCTTDFCNGPLPSCDSQLHFITSCVRKVNGLAVIISALSLLILCSITVCFFRINQRNRLRAAHLPLVPLSQRINKIETMQYTHI